MTTMKVDVLVKRVNKRGNQFARDLKKRHMFKCKFCMYRGQKKRSKHPNLDPWYVQKILVAL